MKKIAVFAITMALAGGILAGCSSSEPEQTPAENEGAATEQTASVTPEDVTEVEMKYISPADTEANLDNDEYLIVDVRKAADYEAGHIPGAIPADMDAANKGGDIQNGLDTMSAAMTEATGAENGNGKTLVLVCYSGKSYAQAATNILAALGADMNKVVTMEGGMEAWTGATE